MSDRQGKSQKAIRLGTHGEDYGSWMSNPVFYMVGGLWFYVKKKYKLNMPFLVLSYPAKASALLSNAA